MTKKLKKLKRHASDLTKDQQELIEKFKDEVEMRLASGKKEVENLPDGRAPSPSLRNSLKELRKQISEGLEREGIEFDEFPQYQELINFDTEVRNSVLKHLVKKIGGASSIDALEDYYQIYSLYEEVPEEKRDHLEEQYILALRALFKHPKFIDSVKAQGEEMARVIVTDHKNKGSIKRNQTKVFIDDYDKHKTLNPQLEKDKEFNQVISEVTATLYLQRQSDALIAGEIQINDELVSYVNKWIDYLNDLTDEEMDKKIALHGEVAYCAGLIDGE